MAERISTLDSSVIIALAGGLSPVENAQERMVWAVRADREAGIVLAIPAPAYAECCHAEDDILRQLRILPLGAKAAHLANDITPALLEMRKEFSTSSRQVTRREVKVDAMILGVALAAGAESIYGGLPIRVLDIPPLPEIQGDLPLREHSRA